MNPYKAIRKAAKGVGYGLVAVLVLIAVVVFTLALVFFTSELWSYVGAWSLTWPIALLVVVALILLACASIVWLFEQLGKWWRQSEREWGTR